MFLSWRLTFDSFVLFFFFSTPAPRVDITIDGKSFSGKSPNNKAVLAWNKTVLYHLSGHYSDAVDYASVGEFESPDGGTITQGTSHNTSKDVHCNHEGHTTNGSVLFDETGNYTIIYRVQIASMTYEATVIVEIQGGSLTWLWQPWLWQPLLALVQNWPAIWAYMLPSNTGLVHKVLVSFEWIFKI